MDVDGVPVSSGVREDGVAALTHRMVRGDEAAYRRFFDGYYPRLLRYLLVVTHGSTDISREAIQGTFLRVVRHIRVFESEEVFWSWLTRLTRTALYDLQRKHGRYRSFLSRFSEQGSRDEGAEEAARAKGNDSLSEILERMLLELPPDERGLIEDKYLERMTVEAIASQRGMTEKAVESWLTRIRRKLKQSVLTEMTHERRT